MGLAEMDDKQNSRKPVMAKLAGLSDEQVSEISHRIADAFFDYEYNEEDIGLIKFISTREDMFTYMDAIVRAAYKSGVLYTTSERQEGYLMLSGEGAGGSIGFIDGMKMIMAEVPPMARNWALFAASGSAMPFATTIRIGMRRAAVAELEMKLESR